MFTPQPTATGPVATATPYPTPARPKGPPHAPHFVPPSMFGMNLYLTGFERSDAQANALAGLAVRAGVRWSREELSWANIEDRGKGQYNNTNIALYDRRIALNTDNGIQVIGMLLTTPQWAGVQCNASAWWWCAPRNSQDYVDFVRWAVTRWRDRIHVWEIWNEPDVPITFDCGAGCNRAAKYAEMLAGAYAAIKQVDPNARVLIGGLSVHDYNNNGMAFLNQVVTASGGAINFDALSIHTYMPDRVPESTEPTHLIQNFQYRLYMANDWIAAHGGRPAEIWVTEDGRSTCGTCDPAFRWSEDQQASMLVRMYGIAASTPRVVHFNYFQFEDKFNNPNDLWGGMAIVRDDLSVKPAYNAYSTAVRMLDGATYTGTGPQMIPGNNPYQPDTSDYVGFDYRFLRAGTSIHVVWRVNSTVTVDYPVETAQVDLVDRDGGTTRLTASNGRIRLTISPRPVYVVSVGTLPRFIDVPPGSTFYTYIECLASRGIIGGYSDGTFRPDNFVTRGQLSKIVANAAGFSEPVSGQTFSDVPPSHPFYVYIERMARRGIIGGYSDGTFRPDNNATRGQISKIVANSASIQDPIPSNRQTFSDVPPTHPFWVYIERLAGRGILGGYSDGTFRPDNNATRGQTAKIVSNAFFPGCSGSGGPAR